MLSSHRALFLGALCLLPLTVTWTACDEPRGSSQDALPLLLRSGPLAPVRGGLTDGTPGTTARVVVRFERSPDVDTVERIRALGGRVDAVLSSQAYLVSVPSDRAAQLESLPHAAWATPYPAAAKLAPEIATLGLASSDAAAAMATVVVELFADAELDRVAADMRALGLDVVGQRHRGRFGRLVIRASENAVVQTREQIAAHPAVFWVGRRAQRTLLNETSVWVGQSGLDGGNATPIFDHGIRGEGQIAAVLDSGVDADHCAFWDETNGKPPTNEGFDTAVDMNQRKIIAYDFLHSGDDPDNDAHWDGHGHGTHVAGTIAGDNGSNGTHETFDGMAPAAKLVVQDGGGSNGYTDDCSDMPALGCPVADLIPIFDQAYAQGARVHNNSWGDRENSDVQNDYSDATQDVDEFMWDHPDFLLVFAGGNSGPGADSICSPSIAKSALSVGATQRGANADSLASFSSRGPTADGRIKPDVSFPGQAIVSASNDTDVTTLNCGSRNMSGTSMASPGAAGIALLVRQYFADGYYPSGVATPADAFQPSAALIKAALIGSTTPMANESEIPSMDQGWGRLQLDRVLAFDDSAFKLFAHEGSAFSSANDTPHTFSVEVLSANQPLKATLVWTDYPATVLATTTIVNDLDLAFSGPSGDFLGNVFASGQSTTGGSADRINTVEQISILAPTVGVHTLDVSAFAVPMGPQNYALVISGDISVTPPDGGDTGGESSSTSDSTDSTSATTTTTTTTTSDESTGESSSSTTSTTSSTTATTSSTTSSSGSETSTGASTSDSGSSTSTGTSDASSTSSGEESTAGTDDDGPSGEEDGTGCACRTERDTTPASAIAPLVIAWMMRRRRRNG